MCRLPTVEIQLDVEFSTSADSLKKRLWIRLAFPECYCWLVDVVARRTTIVLAVAKTFNVDAVRNSIHYKMLSASCAAPRRHLHWRMLPSIAEMNQKWNRHTELELKQYCALPIAINHAVWEAIWLEPLSSHCPPKSSIDAVSRPKSGVLGQPRHRRNVMIASRFQLFGQLFPFVNLTLECRAT